MFISGWLQKRRYKSIIYSMIKLDPEICRRLKKARRDAGLSQTIVANEVGCKQSALSMFEQGDGTKLNEETVKKLCEKFSIAVPEIEEENLPVPRLAVGFSGEKGFCPNPACPSHLSYKVDGVLFLRPDRDRQDPVGGKFCAVCGEVLEKTCPDCGMPVHEGAVCSYCGRPYVAIAQ